MALIHVPRPPKSACDPKRPVSSLLKAQMEHLHEAEKRLPTRYHSEIYVNAIKTEGEAANYIRKVTEAIHRAHKDAEDARRMKLLPRPEREIAIAAVADEPPERKPAKDTKGKKNSGSTGQKQS